MRLIDTNIFVHAFDNKSKKQERAQEVLSYYMGTQEAVVSLQTILELYAALTKVMSTENAKKSAEKTLESNSIKKIEVKEEDILDALILANKKGLRRSDVFDALLVANAKRNGITTVLTENVKHFEGLGLEVETLDTATLCEGP